MALLVISTWAIALQASMIFRRCAGDGDRASSVAGMLILLIAFSPISYRMLRSANISPIIGALIGSTLLAMLSKRTVSASISVTIGALLKYATVVLIPVMMAMRQWRSVALTAAISLTLLAASLLVIGFATFEEFARIILPDMLTARPTILNQSLEAVLIRYSGADELSQPMEGLLRALCLGVLAVIVVLLSRLRRDAWSSPSCVCAGCAAMICWLLVFSPVFWPHYLAYIIPLWGWLAWEARQPRWRIPIGVAIALTWITFPAQMAQLVPRSVESVAMAHVLIGVAMVGAFAIYRLAVGVEGIVTSPDSSSPPQALDPARRENPRLKG
jgi:hypothetical protein